VHRQPPGATDGCQRGSSSSGLGSRFYAYIWTMHDAMVAAAQTGPVSWCSTALGPLTRVRQRRRSCAEPRRTTPDSSSALRSRPAPRLRDTSRWLRSR